LLRLRAARAAGPDARGRAPPLRHGRPFAHAAVYRARGHRLSATTPGAARLQARAAALDLGGGSGPVAVPARVSDPGGERHRLAEAARRRLPGPRGALSDRLAEPGQQLSPLDESRLP